MAVPFSPYLQQLPATFQPVPPVTRREFEETLDHAKHAIWTAAPDTVATLPALAAQLRRALHRADPKPTEEQFLQTYMVILWGHWLQWEDPTNASPARRLEWVVQSLVKSFAYLRTSVDDEGEEGRLAGMMELILESSDHQFDVFRVEHLFDLLSVLKGAVVQTRSHKRLRLRQPGGYEKPEWMVLFVYVLARLVRDEFVRRNVPATRSEVEKQVQALCQPWRPFLPERVVQAGLALFFLDETVSKTLTNDRFREAEIERRLVPIMSDLSKPNDE
jgi:hypothetical protein